MSCFFIVSLCVKRTKLGRKVPKVPEQKTTKRPEYPAGGDCHKTQQKYRLSMANQNHIVKLEKDSEGQIQRSIILLRGKQVLLDFQLAAMYGVSTKVLNQAVKRNIARFPEDFMFQLNLQEFATMRSHFVTTYQEQDENQPILGRSIATKRNISALPYAFTEQGVAMLSSVLRSETAVQMNIAIMCAFVMARQITTETRENTLAIEELRTRMRILENTLDNNSESVNDLSERMKQELKKIYKAIGLLSRQKQEPLPPIGFEAIETQRKAKDNNNDK